VRFVAFAFIFFTSTAYAARDEAILAIEPGAVVAWSDRDARGGFLGTMTGWWGVDDFAWLAVSASVGAVGASSDRSASPAFEALAGGALALDVFRWVPWAELLVGIAGPSDDPGATGRLGLGADYLVSPAWAVGPAVRIRPIPAPDGLDDLASVHLRISRRFEL